MQDKPTTPAPAAAKPAKAKAAAKAPAAAPAPRGPVIRFIITCGYVNAGTPCDFVTNRNAYERASEIEFQKHVIDPAKGHAIRRKVAIERKVVETPVQ